MRGQGQLASAAFPGKSGAVCEALATSRAVCSTQIGSGYMWLLLLGLCAGPGGCGAAARGGAPAAAAGEAGGRAAGAGRWQGGSCGGPAWACGSACAASRWLPPALVHVSGWVGPSGRSIQDTRSTAGVAQSAGRKHSLCLLLCLLLHCHSRRTSSRTCGRWRAARRTNSRLTSSRAACGRQRRRQPLGEAARPGLPAPLLLLPPANWAAAWLLSAHALQAGPPAVHAAPRTQIDACAVLHSP